MVKEKNPEKEALAKRMMSQGKTQRETRQALIRKYGSGLSFSTLSGN
jgi:hypothetical protein